MSFSGKVQYEFAKRVFEELLREKPKFSEHLSPAKTPILLLDTEGIKSRYVQIKYQMQEVEVYYAVKANDHPKVIESLAEVGSGFEVASTEELRKVLGAGVAPEKIISSNPVKPLDFIDFAYSCGVKRFALDSFEEVEKIRKVAPRARIYVRITVPNEGSDWPLSRKFGTDLDEALELLEYSQRRGLVPIGITFHVGSQCNNLRNWFIAIKRAATLWNRAKEKGIKLLTLNMGGGIPVRYAYEAIKVEDIAYYVRGLLRKYFPSPPHELQIEPGRGIVGDQGLMITRVIGKARRGGENWLYIDSGVFNGLAEALGGIRYAFYLRAEGELKEWVIGGVSCDSMDVVAKSVYLPEPRVGDFLFIPSAGAYTTVYASNFNGFPQPEVLCL